MNKKRMEYAASLLQTCPEYAITTIAKLCGISLSNFNKMFQSKYGMAPTEFGDKPKWID
ncbi:AraC family transcriptional regulator [Bacteroides sp. GD17]|uniref:AraC family transcriptional regulator n=1 Tax=Bacteroides sp. GD17 TaxID=3139826 RepID=UPI00406C9E13